MTTTALPPIKGSTASLSSIKALGDLETFLSGNNQKAINAKFEEMINEFARVSGSPITGPMNKSQRGFSLSAILAQSLQNGDKQMLEAALCVSSAQHNSVLQISLAKLPIPSVLPLLEAIVSRMTAKPRRSLHLMPWLRNLLLCHATYLSTVPSASKLLAPLQQSVEDRLAVLPSMQKLSGRLDLILTQAKLRDQMQASAALIDEEPLAVYDESEDEEEEMEESEGSDGVEDHEVFDESEVENEESDVDMEDEEMDEDESYDEDDDDEDYE
jgi:U3 small nucleolar RNA-associated protein 5